MDELLKMGFPQELASEALAATGGKCAVKATTWLLDEADRRSRTISLSSSSSFSSSPSSSSVAASGTAAAMASSSKHMQAKVDRFFWRPASSSRLSSCHTTEPVEDGSACSMEGAHASSISGNCRNAVLCKNSTFDGCKVPVHAPTEGSQSSDIKQSSHSLNPASDIEEGRNPHALSSSSEDLNLFIVEGMEESKTGVGAGMEESKTGVGAPPFSLKCKVAEHEVSISDKSALSFSSSFIAKRKRVDDGIDSQPRPALVPSKRSSKVPLAERMRPLTVDEIVGQDHLLGPGCILQSLLQNDSIPSAIFWGPPGTGKTSLARAVSRSVSCRFVMASAVNTGVKEVREILEEAKRLKKIGQRTLFFMDEVHRFNKAQQDAFLPYIEAGQIVFIGATTENPSFEVNAALLSRCRVLTLNKLQVDDVKKLLKRALLCEKRGVLATFADGHFVRRINIEDEALGFLAEAADGDARVALNTFEVAVASAVSKETQQIQSRLEQQDREILVRLADVSEALQRSHVLYDKKGEEHYNVISALHKAMRGGDPDAALYWLARMLEGGEGPLYIARRLIRFASEDVGLADPQALMLAVACYQACHFVGMPECDVNLGQCVAYLSLAPKSIAVYQAVNAVRQVVRDTGQNESVPLHLRNAPTGLMKQLGYGEGYIYPPTSSGQVKQEYLPSSLQGFKFLKWP